MKRQIARTLAAAALMLSPNYAQAAGQSFEGAWNLTHDCKGAPGGGDAFTVFYPAKVDKNGNIDGMRRKKGVDGYFHLTGHINPDGTTDNLNMEGQTDLPKYNVKHVNAGIKFRYPLSGSFTSDEAILKRGDGQRDCTITLRRGSHGPSPR